MSYVLTIIAFVLIFSVLVLVHELGHFWMAKRAGIKVEEFGFGLPPRIWGKKKGETIYSINWIPFGGFVRMLGEDALDPKMIKKKRSFAAASMRNRVKVIVAGVVMNFFLAWILLTVGFSAGMQPLLTPEDALGAVDEGVVVMQEGIIVSDILPGSLAEELGFAPGDVLYSYNGDVIDSFVLEKIGESGVGSYKVLRDGRFLTYDVLEEDLTETESLVSGLLAKPITMFPRVKVFNVDEEGVFHAGGIRNGDVLVSVNGQQIFSVAEFEEIVRGVATLNFEIYRNGARENVFVERPQIRKVIVTQVFPDSPADEVGIKAGDIILSVNGNNIDDSPELIDYVANHKDENLAYVVEREGQAIFFEVKPGDDGRIGVMLSELVDEGIATGLTLYNVDVLSSVMEIKDQKFPVHLAMKEAFFEGFRLSKLTAEMFVGVIRDLVGGAGVPDSVAGPVGIAQMTHGFVQEGLIPLLRFVAILSLSLAVINILPIPALDGGRLLFILIELIIGRRVNQKWESVVHMLGYAFILLLIIIVTFNDVMRLIGV